MEPSVDLVMFGQLIESNKNLTNAVQHLTEKMSDIEVWIRKKEQETAHSNGKRWGILLGVASAGGAVGAQSGSLWPKILEYFAK